MPPDKAYFMYQKLLIFSFLKENMWVLTMCLADVYIMSTHNICFHIFFSSPRKTNVVGTHCKRLFEALLMSTQNMCFCGETRIKGEAFLMGTLNISFRGERRKLFTRYPLLTRAMFEHTIFNLITMHMIPISTHIQTIY